MVNRMNLGYREILAKDKLNNIKYDVAKEIL